MTPDALKQMPQRNPEFDWLFEAYAMLTRSRQIGMSEYYIPMSEYAAYLDIIMLDDPEQRILLVSVLTEVDAVLLSERLAAQAQKTSQ